MNLLVRIVFVLSFVSFVGGVVISVVEFIRRKSQKRSSLFFWFTAFFFVLGGVLGVEFIIMKALGVIVIFLLLLAQKGALKDRFRKHRKKEPKKEEWISPREV